MKTFIVDSFTDVPFRGNPAGVCLTDVPLSDETMLHVAQELNLSETAFLRPLGAAGHFAIRFFSPKMEIPLCGHATLASAKVIFAAHGLSEARFTNVEGLELSAREQDGRIEMTFPVYDTHPATAPPALLAALGIGSIRNAASNEETRILLLEIEDPTELARLAPDFAALYRSHDSISGVLVTAASGADGYDFHSRYFWPWSGTNEDPVTGGTHTFLAKYWSTRLGKTRMKSFQSSQRTGFMEVELAGGKLLIRGAAVIVLEGRLVLPDEHPGEPARQLFRGINVVSIAVPDLAAARRFYSEVLSFGTPIYDLPEAGWIEFSAGGGGSNIAVTTAGSEPGQGQNQKTIVVLNTDDCHRACEELRARGVRCEDPIVFPGYVTYCSFYDPFGNKLQMCSPAPE